VTDLRISTRHITRVYRLATIDDRNQGHAWYASARLVAESLDPSDPARAAAVIAVLSPQLAWRRNILAAQDAYADRPIRALGANAAKARRIIAGEDPDAVVRGAKVRAFWRTIVDPTDPRAVVIDRHAIDIAAGRVLGTQARDLLLGRKTTYDSACELYRRAARLLSREFGAVSPAQVQATTWLYWRREHAVAFHG
jgi:hypothetical protein